MAVVLIFMQGGEVAGQVEDISANTELAAVVHAEQGFDDVILGQPKEDVAVLTAENALGIGDNIQLGIGRNRHGILVCVDAQFQQFSTAIFNVSHGDGVSVQSQRLNLNFRSGQTIILVDALHLDVVGIMLNGDISAVEVEPVAIAIIELTLNGATSGEDKFVHMVDGGKDVLGSDTPFGGVHTLPGESTIFGRRAPAKDIRIPTCVRGPRLFSIEPILPFLNREVHAFVPEFTVYRLLGRELGQTITGQVVSRQPTQLGACVDAIGVFLVGAEPHETCQNSQDSQDDCHRNDEILLFFHWIFLLNVVFFRCFLVAEENIQKCYV